MFSNGQRALGLGRSPAWHLLGSWGDGGDSAGSQPEGLVSGLTQTPQRWETSQALRSVVEDQAGSGRGVPRSLPSSPASILTECGRCTFSILCVSVAS